jgi:putative peptidoglycan lipid II flippase
VLSAWCLGVLNSHRRFFLSYASPVLWNSALIACALYFGSGAGIERLAELLAWAAVIGSGLQLLVQVPTVWALLGTLRPSLDVKSEGVRKTVGAFGPVLLGRGSVQISAYLDQLLASYLGPAMVSAMAYAQTIYLLPVALFGMAISAAELPEMSSATGGEAEVTAHVRKRLEGGLRKVVFFVTPSAIAFLAVGAAIVAALFQTGRFGGDDTRVVWLILCGSSIGLLASTQGRLLASAFYAMGDTKTPLRCAVARVLIGFAAGFAVALPLRRHYGYSEVWGAFGLTAAASLSAWLEMALLRRGLAKRLDGVPMPRRLTLECLAAALVAGGAAWAVDRQLSLGPWPRAAVVLPIFGVIYLGLTVVAFRIPEARRLIRR